MESVSVVPHLWCLFKRFLLVLIVSSELFPWLLWWTALSALVPRGASNSSLSLSKLSFFKNNRSGKYIPDFLFLGVWWRVRRIYIFFREDKLLLENHLFSEGLSAKFIPLGYSKIVLCTSCISGWLYLLPCMKVVSSCPWLKLWPMLEKYPIREYQESRIDNIILEQGSWQCKNGSQFSELLLLFQYANCIVLWLKLLSLLSLSSHCTCHICVEKKYLY